MSNLFIAAAATALMLVSAGTHAQGVAPGGPIGGSTGIGSGLGGVIGTGPSWPNGTNQAPQPSIPSVPPGGYGHPAPSFASPPAMRPSPYPQPGEPFASTAYRLPAAIPLMLPESPASNLAFLRGCWRSDVFAHAQHPGSTTWCFDDKGIGRFLYTRVDRTDFFCHAEARADLGSGELHLRSVKTSCDDGTAAAPAGLTCRDGIEGALCNGDAGDSWTVRLYRIR
jgi:hypothetical protein